jgi:hypothetical protein
MIDPLGQLVMSSYDDLHDHGSSEFLVSRFVHILSVRGRIQMTSTAEDEAVNS